MISGAGDGSGCVRERLSGAFLPQGVDDPAAAQELVTAIDDHALARGHAALRRPELGPEALAVRLDHSRHVLAAVSDPDLGLERAVRWWPARHPRDAVGHKARARQ